MYFSPNSLVPESKKRTHFLPFPPFLAHANDINYLSEARCIYPCQSR